MTSEAKFNFVNSLHSWHSENDRQLPWKTNKDPYQIWLSEIILQQTRVAQGLPYFERFLNRFPTVFDLAQAEESEVFKVWEGLGYYSRAKNLHHTAKEVATAFGGIFPDKYQGLLSLKGVGPYTAAAIASFAFDLPHAVLDGNVFRVLARVFGIDLPADQPAGKQYFQKLAESLLPVDNASKFNQAIMDFGALQCVPQNPNCTECPMQHICIAFQTGRIKDLPFKSKRIVKQNRYFHFFEIYDANSIWIEKRNGKDIWQGLYQFPLIESIDPLLENESDLFPGIDISDLIPVFSSKQQLTHRTIHAAFYRVESSSIGQIPENCIKTEPDKLMDYPFPRIIHDYLKSKEWLSHLRCAAN
jgi:A/G-specific adenine glycosylase